MTVPVRKVYYTFHPGQNSSMEAAYVSLPREPWYEGEDEGTTIMALHEQGFSSREIADKIGFLSSSAVRRYIAKRKRKKQ